MLQYALSIRFHYKFRNVLNSNLKNNRECMIVCNVSLINNILVIQADISTNNTLRWEVNQLCQGILRFIISFLRSDLTHKVPTTFPINLKTFFNLRFYIVICIFKHISFVSFTVYKWFIIAQSTNKIVIMWLLLEHLIPINTLISTIKISLFRITLFDI